PYPTLHRPFAMPCVKDEDWSGALFVGAGESRFELRIDLLTASNTVLREKLTNNIYRIGPMTPDGSYKELQISTDDRTVTEADLDALREVIAHPDWFDASMVTQATTDLPTYETKYQQTQADRRTILIRYARTGDGSALVGSVTALDADATVFLETASPYGEGAAFALSGSGVTGTEAGMSDPAQPGYFRLSPSAAPASAGAYATEADMVTVMTGGTGAPGTVAAALTYHLAKGQTITFRAAVGDQPPSAAAPVAGQILATLGAARAKADSEYLTGTGATGRAAVAVRDALSLNTTYDPATGRNYVLWGWGGGGGLFTGWDSSFDAIDASLVSRDLAIQHENDIFDAAAPPNQVPIHGPRYDQENSGPMHAYAVWRLYGSTGDLSLLQKAYPILTTFYGYLPEWDADGDGLLESPYFGPRVSGRGDHLGLDDLPVYADYQPLPKRVSLSGDARLCTNLTDLALNAYYALMADILARMADVLRKPSDAAAYRADHARIGQGVNDKLWNAERGLYLSRYLDGTWNEVSTATVFYPLLAGIATPDRAGELITHLVNPDEFWGDYVVPSVARDDPAYCSGGPVHPQSAHFMFYEGYGQGSAPEEWKGAIWPPMNATVYDGLKRYGFDQVAGEFAAKSTAIYLDTWDKDNWFAESFDPEPGQLVMDSAVDSAWRTYSWSNAMAVTSLHELFGDDPWGVPGSLMFGTLSLPGTNTIGNVVLRGHTYAVSAGPRETVLSQDGHVLFRATGGRVTVRNFVPSAGGGSGSSAAAPASFEVNASAPATIMVFPPGGGKPWRRTVPTGRTLLSA
ncbi:MAG: MGH1-like glycoside hydrolase domain-containing protein, partial [Trebonia sp.]